MHNKNNNGHTLTAFLRNPDKFQLKDKNLIVVEGELNDKSAVSEASKGQDAVIWCVGIPLKRKYEKMESLEDHQILFDAMKTNRVKTPHRLGYSNV